MQRRVYGRATDVAIKPLNEERAVQAASTLIGELFVFSVISISHLETSCIFVANGYLFEVSKSMNNAVCACR